MIGASADGSRRLPQRDQRPGLHRRDRSLQPDRRDQEAHRARPHGARKRRLLPGRWSASRWSCTWATTRATSTSTSSSRPRPGTPPTPARPTASPSATSTSTRQALRREVQRRRHRPWIELDLANPAIAGYAGYAFADAADSAIHPRLAADAAGATKMDRPEWCGVHPDDRRGLLHADQQQQPRASAAPARSSHRRRQPARLQRHPRRRDRAVGQPQRPHHPHKETAASRAATTLHLGHLPVRRRSRRATPA